jgi:hypothetical protein
VVRDKEFNHGPRGKHGLLVPNPCFCPGLSVVIFEFGIDNASQALANAGQNAGISSRNASNLGQNAGISSQTAGNASRNAGNPSQNAGISS